uniref:Uncharacterized protein n=1 Tax=Triticum urartu TaxID=4572 RepID=A0A8R7TI06_TRIUA
IRSSPASLSAGSGCPDLCLPSPRPTEVTVALSSLDPASLPWPSPPHTPPQLASGLPPMSRRCYIIRRGSGCTAPGALAHPVAMAGSPLPACPFPPAALMAASPRPLLLHCQTPPQVRMRSIGGEVQASFPCNSSEQFG